MNIITFVQNINEAKSMSDYHSENVREMKARISQIHQRSEWVWPWSLRKRNTHSSPKTENRSICDSIRTKRDCVSKALSKTIKILKWLTEMYDYGEGTSKWKWGERRKTKTHQLYDKKMISKYYKIIIGKDSACRVAIIINQMGEY